MVFLSLLLRNQKPHVKLSEEQIPKISTEIQTIDLSTNTLTSYPFGEVQQLNCLSPAQTCNCMEQWSITIKLSSNTVTQKESNGGGAQHSGWGLHYCHTAVHTNVTAVTFATSVTFVAVYLTVLWQQWPRLHCDSNGNNTGVSAV